MADDRRSAGSAFPTIIATRNTTPRSSIVWANCTSGPKTCSIGSRALSSLFASIGDKLLAALEKAEDGAIEWVSDAKIESYHTLWFELHEDLLRLMGREREE